MKKTLTPEDLTKMTHALSDLLAGVSERCGGVGFVLILSNTRDGDLQARMSSNLPKDLALELMTTIATDGATFTGDSPQGVMQ